MIPSDHHKIAALSLDRSFCMVHGLFAFSPVPAPSRQRRSDGLRFSMAPGRCTEVPKRLPSHTKMKSCICDESLYPALFLNAILCRIFENDQQSGFRLDGFSRLTHFQSGIIVFCLLYSTSYPISRSPSDVSPHIRAWWSGEICPFHWGSASVTC
jgi:hypothetical protein